VVGGRDKECPILCGDSGGLRADRAELFFLTDEASRAACGTLYARNTARMQTGLHPHDVRPEPSLRFAPQIHPLRGLFRMIVTSC
jgi:hypothetical protein